MRDSLAHAVSASCSSPIHLSLWIKCLSSSTSTCLGMGFFPESALTECIELSFVRTISDVIIAAL